MREIFYYLSISQNEFVCFKYKLDVTFKTINL